MNPHYEAVLADLRQMKADAEAGIVAIERLASRSMGGARPSEQPPPVTPASIIQRPFGFNAQSAATQIVEFLNSNTGRTFTIEVIGKGVGAYNLKTIRGALSRLAKDKKIGKYGRGKYRATRNPSAQVQDISEPLAS